MKRDQLEMLVSLDDLVAKDHPYRRFERVVDLDKLSSPLHALYSDKGRAELGADRNLGRIGRFACWCCNLSRICRIAKWSGSCAKTCPQSGFGLGEKTPDHSSFGTF